MVSILFCVFFAGYVEINGFILTECARRFGNVCLQSRRSVESIFHSWIDHKIFWKTKPKRINFHPNKEEEWAQNNLARGRIRRLRKSNTFHLMHTHSHSVHFPLITGKTHITINLHKEKQSEIALRTRCACVQYMHASRRFVHIGAPRIVDTTILQSAYRTKISSTTKNKHKYYYMFHFIWVCK